MGMMTNLECVRQISQALFNLPEDYPFKNEANEAFGTLILGHFGLKEPLLIKLPDENSKFTLLIRPKSDKE